MPQAHLQNIGREVRDRVRILDRALVPIPRDSLVALLDGVAPGLAADGEPSRQSVVGELALGVLGRVVGHEAVDERVAGRRKSHSAQRPDEEVRVAADLLVPALRAERGQGIHGDDAVGGGVDEVLVLVDHEQVVVAGFVEIRTRDGTIVFVPSGVSMA